MSLSPNDMVSESGPRHYCKAGFFNTIDHLQTLVAEVSASMDLAFLIIGLAALGLLAVGLLTGEMPNSVGNPTRQARPRMFWSLALVYGLIAGMSLIKAVASVS